MHSEHLGRLSDGFFFQTDVRFGASGRGIGGAGGGGTQILQRSVLLKPSLRQDGGIEEWSLRSPDGCSRCSLRSYGSMSFSLWIRLSFFCSPLGRLP